MAVAKIEKDKWYVMWDYSPPTTNVSKWPGIDGYSAQGKLKVIGMPIRITSVYSSGEDCAGDVWGAMGPKYDNWTFNRMWLAEIPKPADPKLPVAKPPTPSAAGTTPFHIGQKVRLPAKVPTSAKNVFGTDITWNSSSMNPFLNTEQEIGSFNASGSINLKGISTWTFAKEWLTPVVTASQQPSGQVNISLPQPPKWHGGAPTITFYKEGMPVALDNTLGGSTVCKCSILQGCKCGAHEAEMKRKGRHYNPVLKAWMEKVI